MYVAMTDDTLQQLIRLLGVKFNVSLSSTLNVSVDFRGVKVTVPVTLSAADGMILAAFPLPFPVSLFRRPLTSKIINAFPLPPWVSIVPSNSGVSIMVEGIRFESATVSGGVLSASLASLAFPKFDSKYH